MTCEHHKFAADVHINRFEDAQPHGFNAEVRVHCSECGTRFRFLGLAPGMDTQGARVALNGCEAILAICPDGVTPDPASRVQINVSKRAFAQLDAEA